MSSDLSISELRKEYAHEKLDEREVARDPMLQFSRWFEEALKADVPEPNAMTLATANAAGKPSARIVLLKGYDARGFVFFTNYESRKGRELAANAQAALLFHWIELERQVRVEGYVERVSDEESDAYYRSRPLGSRLGAWASPQSTVLPHREDLEARLAEVSARYGDDPPRPAHWGGYRLVPQALEFWQGRPDRLHDRLHYLRQQSGEWKIERLAP
ncbi:MAG TPA: pyridoxamine 5'-phosphate oxidase [Burkholderiales bacterium]|nr:pyridoxamine 5'-phosphate oxidase [Burkholderiales bacterium]